MLHLLDKIITIIKMTAAFVEEVCFKTDIILKACGVNNKHRVFLDYHVAVEFQEADFLQGFGFKMWYY